MLPRGIERIEWSRLRRGECAFLRSLDADLILVNPQDVRREQEAETLRRFVRGVVNYEELRRLGNRFPIRPCR